MQFTFTNSLPRIQLILHLENNSWYFYEVYLLGKNEILPDAVVILKTQSALSECVYLKSLSIVF